MQLCVGRLPFGEFDGRNAQTPYIGFVVIPTLLDDLRRHPIGSAHERVLLGGQGAGKLSGDAKVCELDLAAGREKDVGSLDVAVQLAFRVEVLETAEEFPDDDGNIFFPEDTWLHLDKVE